MLKFCFNVYKKYLFLAKSHVTEKGQPIASAVASTCKVAASTSAEMEFCLSWDMPQVRCLRLIRARRSRLAYAHLAPINNRLDVVVRSLIPFVLGQNRYWFSRGFSSPRALLSYKPFFRHAPSQRPQHAASLKSVVRFLSFSLAALLLFFFF